MVDLATLVDGEGHDGRVWYRSDRVFPLVAAPALRSTPERFWDKPSVRDWSARGNGSTHDDAAFQSAAAYSANNNFGMYVPRGIYLLEEAAPIETTKRLSIYGDGGDGGSRIIARNFNTSLFRYKTVGTEMNYFRVTNLRIDFDYTDVANPSDESVAFEFGGDANFIQEATFDNLIIRGPRHAFKSTKPSHTTIYGEEGTVARILYHNIQLADWTRQMEVGWDFPAGSGTANSGMLYAPA